MNLITRIVVFLFIVLNVVNAQTSLNTNMTVGKIKFEGLLNAQKDEVIRLIDFKEGTAFNQDTLNDALKKLYTLDMFKSVQADITNVSNSVQVKFIVEENVFIRTVKYEGWSSISREDIMKLSEMVDDSYFTEAKAKRSAQAIQNKYIESGFIDAVVSYKLTVVDVRKNKYDLTFKIDEQKKIVVEKIKFSGNKEVKSNDVKNAMKTKEKFLIFVDGVLKQEDFELDRDMILQFFQHKGFIDAEIKRYEWKIEELDNDKHKAIVVYIDVEEGTKYKTGKITVTGNTLFQSSELMAYADLKTDETYDKIKMDMMRMSIYNKYSDNGHLYANVSLVMNRDLTNFIVDSELVISEGPRAHIESVSISGNTKTLDKVIRRELIMSDGELYVQRKVRQTYERLMQMQYFSDVQMNYLPGSAEGLINLDVGVKEQRTGLFTVGLGYGTESGFNTSASIAENNWFGTGRSITLKGEYGQRAQSLAVSFMEPWIFDDPTFLNVSLGYSRFKYNNIMADSSGIGIVDGTTINYITSPNTPPVSTSTNTNVYYRQTISLGTSISRRFFVYWTGSVGLATSIYQDYDANFNNPLYWDGVKWGTNQTLIDSLIKGWSFKNTLSLSASLNSTDHPLTPTYGNKFNFDIISVGGILGGNNHFIKNKITFDAYFNPVWKIVLAFHANYEFLFPQITGQPIKYDLPDMMYFDGMMEMRGFSGYALRGEAKNFYSAELRFPFIPEIWGVFYGDFGAIWAKNQDWAPFKENGYLYSFGPGIQINIPMLPIRFYMAKKGYYSTALQQFQFVGQQQFWTDWTPVVSIQGLF